MSAVTVAERSAVRAAGGVLWRQQGEQLQVALVHRPKYDDWSLPKGKLEPGEAAVVGAVREVAEETGFHAVAGRSLGESRYRVLDKARDVEKTVQWWAMRAVDGEFVPGPEVDALRWVTPSAALARVSADYDSAPLTAFAAGPTETATVLLVRHASAGERAAWSGPDEERPLDARGLQQAHADADVLAAYSPARVLSAPLARCVATVQPLAARLGLEVEVTGSASDAENADGARALVELVQRLAAADEPAVVCSQGEAIPRAVGALAAASGLDLGERATAKGSVWALTFADGRLIDADHHAPPA